MSRLGWDADLETGDPLVDEQHRRMHDLFNDLEAADDSRSQVQSALEALLLHVATHFETEQRLMQDSGYPLPLAEAHISQHDALRNETRERVLAYREGKLSHTGPLLDFMRSWIVEHIHEHDRRLVEHVRAMR